MTTLELSKIAFLAGVQLILYAVYVAAPSYYVRSLQSDHVEGDMLLQLPNALVRMLSHFGFYRISVRMRLDPVLVALVVYGVFEVDSFSSGDLRDAISFDFARGISHGHLAKRIASMNRQKVD